MKNKFTVYALIVTLLTSGISWSKLLTPSVSGGGSSWSSNSGSGGGSWGGGSGGSGHK